MLREYMLYKEIFGLDISDRSIEAVQLKKKGGKPRLVAYSRSGLDPGIVEDGRILDKYRLSECIKDLLLSAEPKPIKTTYVIASLPESKVLSHVFDLPKNLGREQVENVLKYESEGVIPYDRSKVFWDFKVISKSEDKQEVFYAACTREVISDFRDVFKEAGLFPLALEMESVSTARSLIDPESLSRETGLMILDIGARTTVMSIFDKNGIRDSVNIPVAGNEFTRAISEKLDVPLREAEKIKRAYGFGSGKSFVTKAGKEVEEGMVMMILQSVFQRILEEVRKSVKYYEKKTGRMVKKVILTGGSAAMPDIGSYISDNTGLPVKIGKPWLDLGISSKRAMPVLLANAVGLALRGIDKDLAGMDVNLLPLEIPEIAEGDKAKGPVREIRKLYAKYSRKFQLLNFQEWAATLRKYRLPLLVFTALATSFLVIYSLGSVFDYAAMWQSVSEFSKPFFGSLGKFAGRTLDGIRRIFLTILAGGATLVLAVLSFFAAVFGVLASLLSKVPVLLSGIESIFRSAASFFKSVFKSAFSVSVGLFRKAGALGGAIDWIFEKALYARGAVKFFYRSVLLRGLIMAGEGIRLLVSVLAGFFDRLGN